MAHSEHIHPILYYCTLHVDCNTVRPTALSAVGDIDLVVNNAGIASLQPFLDTTVEAFDEVLAINLRAVMVISQIAAKNMIVSA